MKKNIIDAPDLYTRSHDVLFGVIEVLPQKAENKNLVQNTSFEKHVPIMRALCFNSPYMYKTLRKIVRMAKAGNSNDEIIGLAQKMVESVEQSHSAYKAFQFEED